MDNFGIKVAALLANVLMITAFGVLAAAAFGDISEAGWLVGFVILGSSAIGQLHTLYSVSNLFSERPTLIMGIINGCADGSALLFLVFREIYESGVSLGAIFTGYIVGPLLITTCLALFLWPRWPLVPAAPPVEAAATAGAWKQAPNEERDEPSAAADNTDPPPNTLEPSREGTGVDMEEQDAKATSDAQHASAAAGEHQTEAPLEGKSDPPSRAESDSEEARAAAPVLAAKSGSMQGSGSVSRAHSLESVVPVEDEQPKGGPAPVEGGSDGAKLVPADKAHPYMGLSLKQQALSPVFLGLSAFSIVSLFKFSFYLAAFDAQADFLGQEDGIYTRVLGIVMSCAIVVVPLVGLGIDRYGLHKAVVANFALSLAVSVVQLIPNLEIQAFGTVLFLVFRGFVFTVLSGCLAAEFGFANFGALIGSTSFVAGLLGLLISPLFDLSLNTFDGDFTVANSIVLGFTLLVQGPFTWYYWRYRMAADAAGEMQMTASVEADSSSAAAPVVVEDTASVHSESGDQTAAAADSTAGDAAPAQAAEAAADTSAAQASADGTDDSLA